MMPHDDEAEAARRSLLATITRVLGGEDARRPEKPRPKISGSPAAPAPKPPPAIRSAPRLARPTGAQIPRRPLLEDEGGPTSYAPPADGLLGGTERRKR